MVAQCPHPTIRAPRGARSRLSPPVALRPAGELLAGRYRIVELAGHGATGGVWRAEDELLSRDVAVKQLPHRMTEARIAARVRHPGVAAVHDLVEHRGASWMVMDYYPGGTLAGLLQQRRRLPAPVVAALGLQLVAALAAVHAAGVVHCDIKPTNLLLGEDGRLVLVDFGIAECARHGTVEPAREEGFVVGSPAYMAPELIRGEDAGPAADLWSLGATLYAAVEGRPPFRGVDAPDTLVQVLHDPPATPCHAGRLAPLLDRLLAKDPSARPSPDEVRAELTDVCEATPGGFTVAVTPPDWVDAEPTQELPRGRL